jgi:hypothetical protein
MKLLSKIFNRLRRETRHAFSYARAKCFEIEPTEKDVLRAWHSKSNPSTLEACLQEWIESRPCVFETDLRESSNPDLLCLEADRLIHGPIMIFDRPCPLRPPNLWHEDPLTHQRWAATKHFTRFNVFHHSRDGVTDIRRLWEVGRFGWSLPLVQAFALTKRSDYLKSWMSYVESFIQNNPTEYGPHWLNAMEVSLRGVQWCRALALIFAHDKGSILSHNSSVLRLILPSLLMHGRYTYSHLEWTPHGRTNHYIADLVGLLTLSVFIPQFREANRWRNFAVLGLSREIKAQTDSDGFHAEASTAYHHFVVEMYQLVLALDQQHQLGFSKRFKERVQQMIDTDKILRGPENIDPRIGDDDSGTIFLNEETLKLPKEATPSSPIEFPAAKSHAFQNSGIYVLRSKAISCLIPCGPNGQQGVGGHAHNDKLSLVLHLQGKPILIDPGTFCYSASTRLRDHFRSTRSHNTIQFDKEEQSPFEDWRKLTDVTRARCTTWKDSEEESTFSGEHFGYERFGVVHRRTVQLDKKRHQLKILDELDTSGTHDYHFHLYFAPKIRKGELQLTSKQILFPGGKIVFKEDFPITLIESTCSPVYGQRIPNFGVHFKASREGKWSLAWEIWLDESANQ